MVWRLLANFWYSLVTNGKVEGLFFYSKSVRQGDPLSHCLFIIAAQVFNRGLNWFSLRKLVSFSTPNHCFMISHLAFDDDVLIFTNGSKISLRHLMDFIGIYEKEFGQLVNKEKNNFIVGK